MEHRGEHVKQLIDGKLYDTENSTNLASWSNGHPRESDLWIEETLYKTAEGDYFICGERGAVTPYSKRNEERHAGSSIRPITKHEAAEWTALRNEKDLLENEFQKTW